jgi:hypothetical protein
MRFIRYCAFLISLATSVVASASAVSEPADSIAWYEPSHWGIEGKGWTNVQRYYDRLPSKAEGVVRGSVWGLSRQSAGMSIRFRTEAKEIQVRYTLLRSDLAKPHMAATGVSGADLYTRLENGDWRWIGTAQPTEKKVRAVLIRDMSPGQRTYMMYLPLYNGVDSLAIGVPVGSRFEPVAPRAERPIVFYGTSIMQGACASRPGMAITAILGRRLDIPTINLGFSGNGWMEPELADLLAELDAATYVLDCLPNLKPQEVLERVEPFVRRLRHARPSTPIVLVEGRIFPNAFVVSSRMTSHIESHRILRSVFEKLTAEGMKGLHYLQGDRLLGTDGEGTVDGSHPTDLGMMRYADAYEPVLRKVLRGE